jgi:hypothetical protein
MVRKAFKTCKVMTLSYQLSQYHTTKVGIQALGLLAIPIGATTLYQPFDAFLIFISANCFWYSP